MIMTNEQAIEVLRKSSNEYRYSGYASEEEVAANDLAIAALGGGWRPIEEAPKGGGAEMRTDPKWVDPPKVLLLFADGSQSAGYWDWYYAEGGRGYRTGVSAWIEPVSGEQLAMHYDEPTHFHPLPPSPQGETK